MQLINLGEVCIFNKGKHLKRENMIEGEYPVIGDGKKYSGYHNEFNISENTILCSSYSGHINRYSTKVWASDCFSILSNDVTILDNNYLFYFLKMNQEEIYNLQSDTIKPRIYSKILSNFQIQVPSIAMQQKFIDYCENIEVHISTINKNIEVIKQNNENYLKMCKMRFTNARQFVMKKLGEVCEFKNGKCLTRENMIEGSYPVIGGGKKPSGYHNEFNVPENTILCSSSGANAGFINRYSTRVWASDCFSISSTTINSNYLYYYLKTIQDDIYKLQRGALQPHVYSKNIANLKIPIPPLEEQQRIVDFCELQQVKIKRNEELIEQLQKSIDESPDNAKMYLELMVQSLGSPEVQEDIEDISPQLDDEPIPNILE